MQFLNSPDDCQWLRSTHLKGCAIPEFQSFTISGCESSPREIQLYKSIDPLWTDSFFLIDTESEESPVLKGWATYEEHLSKG